MPGKLTCRILPADFVVQQQMERHEGPKVSTELKKAETD
jgi:hypothetical protein